MASPCVTQQQKHSWEQFYHSWNQAESALCYGVGAGRNAWWTQRRGCIKTHALRPKYAYISSKFVKRLLMLKKGIQLQKRADEADDSFYLLFHFSVTNLPFVGCWGCKKLCKNFKSAPKTIFVLCRRCKIASLNSPGKLPMKWPSHHMLPR